MREPKHSRSGHARGSTQLGVTLLELLVTITIVSVLATVGIPAFRSFKMNQDRLAATNELAYSLQLARGEALKRAQFVTVCRTEDLEDCEGDGDDWGVGWLVFANTAADNADTVDSDEEIIYRYLGTDDSITFLTEDLGDALVTFWPSGDLGVDATWTWCDSRGASDARAVIIDQAGRARVSEVDVNGDDLECP
jgi:type IV fimbrial biogenesis protein FimT